MPIYQLPGFKAARSRLAINIRHSHMWTMVIFIVLKMLANYNKSLKKLLFMPPRVEGVQQLHFQVFIYVL